MTEENYISYSQHKSSLSDNIVIWLSGWGFQENPFAIYDAAREAYLPRYYIKPPYYEQLRGEPVSSLIFAPRGGGKSAAHTMLQLECRPELPSSAIFAVPLTDFSFLLARRGATHNGLPSSIYLRWILRTALPYLALALWSSKVITKLGISDWGKLHAWADLAGLSSNTEFFSALRYAKTRHSSNIAQNALQQFWMELKNTTPETASIGETPEQQLADFVEFALEILSRDSFRCDYFYLLIDGIEESLPVPNADACLEILRPLLSNLQFLEIPSLAMKFFLPLESRAVCESITRVDRIYSHDISWRFEDLAQLEREIVRMLQNRMRAYSRIGSQTLRDLCEPALRGRLEEEIARETTLTGIMRNAIRLTNQIFLEHCRVNPATRSPLTEDDWQCALETFRNQCAPILKTHVTQQSLTQAPLWMNLDGGQVFLDGQDISEQFTQLEFNLLQYLYQRRGQVCTRAELARAIYPTIKQENQGVPLTNLIYRLRIKLGTQGKDRLRTIARRGYVLDNSDIN